MNADFAQVFRFILEIDRLKDVWRMTKPPGFDRFENSAEHSWQVALLAILLAQYSSDPVDISRVVEILLVHDIPEIEVGDTIVYVPRSTEQAESERIAAEHIFGLLPSRQADWAMSCWLEYEERETPEARFAHAVDRLMPLLHNLGSEGRGWRENQIPFDLILSLNSAAIGGPLPDVWQQVEEAILQHAKSQGASAT